MTTKESGPIQDETMLPVLSEGGEQSTQNQVAPPPQSKRITVVMEMVDMRIELIQQRKQERRMERTLRWPIHSNTPRITF